MVGRQAALLSVIHHRHSGKPLLAKAYMKSNIAFDERLAEALAKQTVPDLTVSDADRKWVNGVVDMNLSIAQTLALAPSSGGVVIGNKILTANASMGDLKQAIVAAHK